MDTNSIFISNNEIDKNINGKITYTSILESIPPTKVEIPITNWQDKYNTEWRWRFLNDTIRQVVEISYIKKNYDKRIYFTKNGEWSERKLQDNYDQFVTKQYYVYTCD